MKYRHLEFHFVSSTKSGKTKIYEIANKSGLILGKIFWYSRWRVYVSEFDDGVIMSDDCLNDVAQFLKELNHDHWINLGVKKGQIIKK